MSVRHRKETAALMRNFAESDDNSSSDTLSEIDRHLGKDDTQNYRQHLSEDNNYADSQLGSPTRLESPSLSAVDEASTVVKTKSVNSNGIIQVKTKRRHLFQNVSTRQQSSILDRKSSRSSTFFGFFTLFWTLITFQIVKTTVHNYVMFSKVLGTNIAFILYKDLEKIALTDLFMYLATYFGVFLQLVIKRNYVDWDTSGWILQNIWQAMFLFGFMWFSDYMEFPWIGKVFLLLHSLVLLMKQHSYAFYNGYFWRLKRELAHSKWLLEKLEVKKADSIDKIVQKEERKHKILKSIEFCQYEINMQSTTTMFPDNITICDYFMYSMFPTLVYQIEYPRTEKIKWDYVCNKLAAIFGVFFLMIVIAEYYIFPIAVETIKLKDLLLQDKIVKYPYIYLDLVIPFLVMILLAFYIIWDAILNCIAELTRFGDREFYGEWWNSVSWDQFAKDWNTPVHRFLLRHVYHSSISAFHVSKYTATCKLKK